MFETRIYFSFHIRSEFDNVITFLNKYLEGYTLYDTIGYWKEVSEYSKVVEIIHNPVELTSTNIRTLAKGIKRIANQESILITKKSITREFI